MMNRQGYNGSKLWIGIGVGAAVGLAIAIRRRRHDRWASAKFMSKRFADRTGDLAEAGKDIVDRIKVIYNESRKAVEEASDLVSQGRKLVGV
jgi:hypothetical protein